jgi:hypothetical protein
MRTKRAAFHSMKCVFKTEFNLVRGNYGIYKLIKRFDIETSAISMYIISYKLSSN